MNPLRFQAPGPFRADQLRSGDPYELSRGHPIHVAPTGGRGGKAQSIAGALIASDPAVEHSGADVGYSPDGGTLRAPDVSVLPSEPGPGWVKGVPSLAIEYADVGQDEEGLRDKIDELLEKGTQVLWVVRMIGPRRVEVWTSEGMRLTHGGDVLEAPGILANPVPVDALYDANLGLELTLRNMLQRFGYRDMAAVRDEGREEGRSAALRDAVRATLAARGLPLSAAVEAALAGADPARLLTWVVRAGQVESAEDLLG
ncbi:MAG: Uma2 family endonuclease [Pseudomonadota bacterium]|nr:Uma2 family endonuclease [Pseudomonadota bacterium]